MKVSSTFVSSGQKKKKDSGLVAGEKNKYLKDILSETYSISMIYLPFLKITYELLTVCRNGKIT